MSENESTPTRDGYIVHTEWIETTRSDPDGEWDGGDGYFRPVKVWLPEDLPAIKLNDYIEEHWDDPDFFVENWRNRIDVSVYYLEEGDEDVCSFCGERYDEMMAECESRKNAFFQWVKLYQVDGKKHRRNICELCVDALMKGLENAE